MSLQSNTSIWKWNITTAARHGLYYAAVLALLLVLPQGHSQTTGTRTTLAVSHESAATAFTVTVKDPTGAAVSGGTVSLMDGGQSLGSAFVNPDGTATVTVDKLPANAKQISAVYSGTQQYAASASASMNVQANDTTAPPDFSISASPSSLTLNPGAFGTSILTVTSENGFAQSVTLSLSGLPGVGTTTSTFTPSVAVLAANGTVTSTLQIQTTAASTMNQALPFGGNAAHLAYAMAFPGVFALLGIGALRKRGGNSLRLFGIAALLLASASGLTACSQRYSYLHHPPAANTGTPAGNYPITITAYSNNGGEVTSHSITLTLVIN
jgi:Bacterial Ig-like domain (group 3)